MPSTVNEGLYRIAGMHGSAYRDGRQLSDAVAVEVAVEIQRMDVPIVGKQNLAYKPGRESREGTMTIQKIDTFWELELHSYMSLSLDERRARRDAGLPSLRPFQLQLSWDDPEALGRETWQLDGVLLWRLPLGFSITDEIVNREYPISWEQERPLESYLARGGIDSTTGLPAITKPHHL